MTEGFIAFGNKNNMTKYLIIIALLVLLYLYWKSQQTKSISPQPDDIIERKGKAKEVFWDAKDFDLNSDNESTNSDYDQQR